MRILMVNKFLYPRGGAESYMLKVGAYFQAQGHTVEYFGMYDARNTVGNHCGISTRNMEFHSTSLKRLLYPFQILYSFEARRKIGRVLDAFRPDVVHMNNINFQLTPAIIDAVKRRNIPLVQTVHDYQMVCPNHLLYDFEAQHVCEKCVGRRKWNCIRHRCIHGSRIKSILGAAEALLYRVRHTYRNVDRYICPSRFLYGKLLAEQPETYRDRAIVLPNFIEKRAKPAQTKRRFPYPYLAFAGRLSEEKGTRVLAETARLLPDVHFVVMGEGPDRAALAGLPNVELTGFLTGAALDEIMAGAEAMVVPSVCFENCPLAILEAQMFGVPSVTMNMGGMAELVRDHETGVLARSTAAEDFAAAVREILSDPAALARMKENCRAAAQRAMTIDRYCKEVLQIYQTVRTCHD